MGQRRLLRQGGSISAEQVAILVVVAAIIAGVWSAGVTDRVDSTAQEAAECLFGPECETTGPSPNADRDPDGGVADDPDGDPERGGVDDPVSSPAPDPSENLPHQHSGTGPEDWTVQGFSFDPGSELAMTTYYAGADDHDATMLSLQDLAGVEVGTAALGGYEGDPDDDGDDRPAPSKAGGVASDGEFVYVSEGGDPSIVYVYRLSDLRNADGDDPVEAVTVNEVPAGSTITVHDGTAHVGLFQQPRNWYDPGDWGDDPPWMYSYEIGEDGQFTDEDGNAGEYVDRTEIPDRAQGMAVVDEGVLVSTSWSTNPSEVWLVAHDGTKTKLTDDLPPYAEGITIVGDELWVSNEGGARKFEHSDQKHITRIRLDDLGVTAP